MTDRIILWAIVIGYMIFIFTKGVMKVKKVGNSDDYLVAGRNVTWFFLFATMGATVIGGGYSIGAIANTYEMGILWLLVSTGGYFHFIFSGLFVAPQFREAELYTVAGYFGYRFGERPRFLVLILSLLFSVFIVAAQMAAFGSVLAAILPQVTDAQHLVKWAIVVSGTMVVIYSTAGGLLAVIHTDIFQFVVLMLGFAITLAFCIPDISSSYNSDTGKFIPSRFGVTDFVSPDALSERIEIGQDSLSAYIRGKIKNLDDHSMDEITAEDGKSDVKADLLADAFNEILEDPEFYEEKRFTGVAMSAQTLELLDKEPIQGRDLKRLNLSLIQDAFPDEINRNRSISANFFKIEGGKGWLFLITTFLAFLLGETFAPGYATRYCVGKNVRETKIGIAGVGFFLAITFPVVLFFIALYARIHYPNIDPQQALPMVVQQLNNPFIGGLIIGALLMAVMSSADSALNSATAIFVKDLFEHQLGWKDKGDGRMLRIRCDHKCHLVQVWGWKDKGDGRMLRLARICTAALGATAVIVAVLWSDIIGLLLFTYHVWAPAIILPVVVGALYKKRSSNLTRNIFITMLVATFLTMLYKGIGWFRDLTGVKFMPEAFYELSSQLDPAVFGVGISCLTFLIMTLATKASSATSE